MERALGQVRRLERKRRRDENNMCAICLEVCHRSCEQCVKYADKKSGNSDHVARIAKPIKKVATKSCKKKSSVNSKKIFTIDVKKNFYD